MPVPKKILHLCCTLLAALGFIAMCMGSQVVAQVRKRPMTVDDQFRLIMPANVLISPDGKWVLYNLERTSLEENARHAVTWIASTDGKIHPRQFLREGDASPMWTPSSRSVLFLRAVDKGGSGGRELFEQSLEESLAVQRSTLGEESSGIRTWQLSRDGTFLLVVRREPMPTGPGATSDVTYVDEGSDGQVRDYWLNVWRFDLRSGKLTRITQREWWINSVDLSADGRYAVIAERPDNGRNTNWKTELSIVDMMSGSVRQITSNAAPESNPVWFPDGRHILFSAVRLDRWVHGNGDLWTVDVATGETENLTPNHTGRFDAPYVMSPDGKYIFVASGYGTTRFPVRIDVGSGRIVPLITTTGVARVWSWSNDCRMFAYTYNDFVTPPDVYVGRAGASADRQTRITDTNPWIQVEINLGSVHRVDWPSFDGTKIEGLLLLPPGRTPTDKRRSPTIVHIACGPGCAWLNSFSAKFQAYAGLGFAQFMPNVRGASNYDDRHMRGNEFDICGGDRQDVLTGVDAMIARGIADPDKLGISGWSYGGVLGGYIITQTNRFKAASLGAMVSDWTSEYGAGASYDAELWYLGGNPWTNPQKWRERSSLTYVHQVVTPTLLHHGDFDDTCLPFQSMNYFVGLRRVGTPARLLRYPDEGHDLYQPKHILLRDKEDLAWMHWYLLGTKDSTQVQSLPPVHTPDPVLPTEGERK